MAKHLLSFDLLADFACFKKPDVNDGLIMTFNCLHKPGLLGILGAITGLKGYSKKGELPEYYSVFRNLPVSIEPLKALHDKGNFNKTVITYTNTVGYANADGNLIITEQTLVCPGYRCYVLVDDTIEPEAMLRRRLIDGESVYLPYLGKNEFSAWWNTGDVVNDYSYQLFSPESDFKIDSVFIRKYPILHQKVNPVFLPSLNSTVNKSSFMYFERLPVGFDEQFYQYELAEFAFTDWTLKSDSSIEDLYEISTGGQKKIIQLF